MGTFGQFCIQIHSKQSLTCRSDEILFVVDFGEDIFDIIINFICYFFFLSAILPSKYYSFALA